MQLSHNEPVAILLPEGSTAVPEVIRLAAEELIRHLERIGIHAAIEEQRLAGRKTILLGKGWDCEADLRTGSLSEDGVAMVCLDTDNLLLSGGSPRGVLNAVYTFLEDRLGFLFVNPEELLLPEVKSWDFTGLRFYYSPPFSKRALSTASALDPQWAAWRKLNFFSSYTRATHPFLAGSHTFAGKHCHNVYKLLSLGYFGTREDPLEPYEDRALIRQLHGVHPEYFALINGERNPYPEGENADISSQHGNISLTHPAVPALLVKGAQVLLEHYPKATIIGLSLRDNYDYCEEAQSVPGGVVAALINLVNRFAEQLERSHPDVRIDFLAYHGTQRPPAEGRFHPNVTVRYCPIRVSQYHAYDESEHNLEGGMNYETPPSLSQPIRQMKRWAEMASEVVVWYYTLHLPYLHPHPGFRAHSTNFKLLKELGVKGCFVQDNSPMAVNQFNDLRAYLLGRLLWNPDIDYAKEMEHFCRRYYGAAAGDVKEYLDLLHDEAMWDWQNWIGKEGVSRWASDAKEESWKWFGDEPAGAFPIPHFYILYHTRPPLQPCFFERAWPLLKRAAERVAGQDLFSNRLEEVFLSFYYGVLSNECGSTELFEEAREWFPPRFEAIRKRYAGSEFHGLDTYGLQWPRFAHTPLEAVAR